MSRKNRRKKQFKARSGQRPQVQPAPQSPAAGGSVATADSAEVDERNAPGAAQDALVAAADIVERAKTVPPAAARTARPARAIAGPRRPSSAVGTETIDIDARVPYFASDLRRILLTAALMIAIIVVASYFIR